MISKNTIIVVLTLAFTTIFLGVSLYYLTAQKNKKETPDTSSKTSLLSIQATTTPEVKIYRNEKWGFEFKYPKDWSIDETFINGKVRKFYLTGIPSQQKHLIYSFSPPFMLNIITASRAERLTKLFYEVKNPASEIRVNGVAGLKYEYKFNKQSRVAIVLPLGQYKLILDSEKKYENIFNQIIFTFKFYNKQPPAVQKTITSKTYHNIEFNFEFKYPKNWLFYENTFYGPFSKFNLIGSSPEENGYPNPISPPFLLNIVTPDFASRSVSKFKELNTRTSIINIANTKAVKYEYEFENATQISIDFQFGKYWMILGTEKKYEDTFNRILASFKFLK